MKKIILIILGILIVITIYVVFDIQYIIRGNHIYHFKYGKYPKEIDYKSFNGYLKPGQQVRMTLSEFIKLKANKEGKNDGRTLENY